MVVKPSPDFVWISADYADTNAYIRLDTQLRFYFSLGAKTKIGERGKSMFPLNIGYDKANKRLIIAKPGVTRPTGVVEHRVDKRGYASARPFLRSLGFSEADLPLTFKFIGKDYHVQGSYAFELTDDERAGGDGGL